MADKSGIAVVDISDAVVTDRRGIAFGFSLAYGLQWVVVGCVDILHHTIAAADSSTSSHSYLASVVPSVTPVRLLKCLPPWHLRTDWVHLSKVVRISIHVRGSIELAIQNILEHCVV